MPVGPLRDAWERSGLSLSTVARRLGRVYGGQADTTYVRRRLGLASHHGAIQTHVGYDVAMQIAQALDVDPVDVGL